MEPKIERWACRLAQPLSNDSENESRSSATSTSELARYFGNKSADQRDGRC